MSLNNMWVSYVGNQITVRIPVEDVPAAGSPLPFSIISSSQLGMPTEVSGVTPGPEAGGYKSYSIAASLTETYMVKVGTFGSSGPSMDPTTPMILPGENYALQTPPGGGFPFFKDLDAVAPQLVSISSLDAFNAKTDTPDVELVSPPEGNRYYVAQFSEGVMGVTNQSFNVVREGAPSLPQEVRALWQNGNVLSTTMAGSAPASSLYLVTVGAASTDIISSITLKTVPTIVSVQEMNAGPSPNEIDGQYAQGSLPSGESAYWLKVSVDGNAGQFLTQNPQIPRLEFELPGDSIHDVGQIFTPPMATYVAAGTNPNVLYLGYNSNNNSIQSMVTEAPIGIKFQTSGPTITDRAGNPLVSSASVTTAQLLNAAGEPVFSKWGDNTTTISDASVLGYANGANIGTDAYKPDAPHYFSNGSPLEVGTGGAPLYDAFGDRIGLDTIDLSGITSSPIVINANTGEAFVYIGNKSLVLDVSDYDRYILNDRAKDANGNFVLGNEFYGTVDSEYVVLGGGGDNFLVAGNGGATDIAAEVEVKNYQFNNAGVVRETDIVDYSQIDGGITINLGDKANAPVYVVYKDGTTQSDTLIGFEGVVGSRGDDDIFGSNVGNALAGGAGDDELRGYTAGPLGDKLYDLSYTVAEYGLKGAPNFKEAQFLVDSSDILYGGAGADQLYGGAGRDMLIDLGKAEMWGSDKTGKLGDGTLGLRDSANKLIAENDVFWVRGDGDESATINNFHLSKDGTGLAGRSNSANDAIMFSVDTTKLFGADPALTASNMSDEALYNYVYSRLSFEQIQKDGNDDIELVVNFQKDNFSPAVKVGSTTIADMGSMLDGGKNRAEVVELKWLSKVDDPLYLFNPKIDMDVANFVDTHEFGNELKIAIALELQKAGTVRGTNEFGVMAAKLSDNGLDKRVYNPGDKDDRILGTAKDDSYDYVVQKFNENPIQDVGDDAIFDVGGTNDVLTFESANLEDLTFSAIRVGRESHANSLRVDYAQTAALDGDSLVTNQGGVTWQGHFQEGGRQAAETLQITGGDFAIAQAQYEYDSKGYVKGGPKITADNARDVIMVGQGAEDKFVFEVSAASNKTLQSAHIAGFDEDDLIDISSYVAHYGNATTRIVGDKAEVTFGDEAFKLELTFQEDNAEQFALASLFYTMPVIEDDFPQTFQLT